MWQPTASRDALLARQRLYQTIRRYFSEQDVTEVETPYLSQASVCDPNIEPMQTLDQRYLHTSPEYAMKRVAGRDNVQTRNQSVTALRCRRTSVSARMTRQT